MMPDSNLMDDFYKFRELVATCPNITTEYLSHMWLSVYRLDWQNRFGEPTLWIGIYIAVASLVCILAMVADLSHGLQNRRLWFPCKYFTLNAASLTVICVAIKLPMDLTNLMPGSVDQATKVGSLAFLCTMMANLLPSLATMNNKELVSNMIALGVVVITLVVNVCIQINTGVLNYSVDEAEFLTHSVYEGNVSLYLFGTKQDLIAKIYVGFLVMLLIIFACSSLAILKSKQILESKYQAAHQTACKDQEVEQQGRILTVEKLKKHVSNCSIMAGTGNPQFMTICFATTTAAGVICVLSSALHIALVFLSISSLRDYKSDYKWSMVMVLIVQFIGVILGTIAPFSRCFAALSFKVSVTRLQKHIKVSKVESYWTQKLHDWKHSSIPIPSSFRTCKIVIQNLKILILSIWIGFQKGVVVACKMISTIPFFFVICVLYFICCWKSLKIMFNASGTDLIQNPEQLGKNKDINRYVLLLEDDIEFAERTLKGMLKSVNHLIQKAEKKQPNNLMKLLAQSVGFEKVEKFDSHHVRSLVSEKYLNCWSLPLVTLTTIAISLPNILTSMVDCLVSGVSEGLVYAALVEESLSATVDHVIMQKAAKNLWVEVEVYHKWLGNKLRKPAPQVNTSVQILQWFSDTAKNMVMEVENTDIRGRSDSSKCRSISANSMYRITETILLSYHADIDHQLSEEELFMQLSLMIADILDACLTNLPLVIAMKCHTSAIEKREASVHAAAQLLGETTQIINTLQDRELPSLNPDELAFISIY